jgi:hypothetical protein
MKNQVRRKSFPKEIILRGRIFSKNDILLISHIIKMNYLLGRTMISKIICEQINWRQPNGWLKDRACRDVLLRLEKSKYIKLPDRINGKRRNKGEDPKNKASTQNKLIDIKYFPRIISLEFAKGNNSEKEWNELINDYHYLGHQIVVGRCIKYIIRGDNIIVGAIAFSSPAWKLSARDRLLGTFMTQNEIHDYVINNCRFLILPSVKVPNLASSILSMATSQIVVDWNRYYSIIPKFVETFVESSRYRGTCYKAANWLEIGTTKGYSKKGMYHHNSQNHKQIFIYGLNHRMRRKLSNLVKG